MLNQLKHQSVRSRCLLIIQLTLLSLCIASVGAASPKWRQPGTLPVETISYDWKDAQRNRAIPVKIYYPRTGAGPFPLIIFSHGLGGSREGYAYLGRHWASHGYICVHVQHLGSDDAVWKNSREPMRKMQASAANLQNAMNRPLDVRFAIDQMAELNEKDGPFYKRVDMKRIGVAGHSFGAYTTLAVAGQVLGPAGGALRDDRVKAAIAMSAPVPRKNAGDAYSKIRIPILHMTGTKDNSPIGETFARDRRIPFDQISGPAQYLITFQGGDHMIFSGRFRLTENPKDAAFQELIRLSSTLFWDAWLKGDSTAKDWLNQGELEKALGADARYEKK